MRHPVLAGYSIINFIQILYYNFSVHESFEFLKIVRKTSSQRGAIGEKFNQLFNRKCRFTDISNLQEYPWKLVLYYLGSVWFWILL